MKKYNIRSLSGIMILAIIILNPLVFSVIVYSMGNTPGDVSSATSTEVVMKNNDPLATTTDAITETISSSISTSTPIFGLASSTEPKILPSSELATTTIFLLPVASTTDSLATTTATTTNQDLLDPLATTTTKSLISLDPTSDSFATTSNNTLSTSTDAISSTTPINIETSTSTKDQPTILSGTAVATANILNILNSNFVNSDGNILFSNFTDSAPTIDLRDSTSTLASICNLLRCVGQQGVSINLLNDGFIRNAILLSASSGNNNVSNATSSFIKTGDAFAGLNLVNISNANFIDSHYLLVTLNAFNGINGDIIFPNLSNFFPSTKFANSTTTVLDKNVGIANIENSATSTSNSGDNTIFGAANSTIQTGTSTAYTNVFNSINQKLQNSKIMIMFRIVGDWNGEIFNMPNGFSLNRESNNLFFINSDNSINNLYSPNDTTNIKSPSLSIEGTSTSNIINDVALSASSGGNTVDFMGENASTSNSTALISTGNAFAGANIVNIANQNVISSNWLLAIINIFGNFKGNISFGRPDLWIGSTVKAPGVINNGSPLAYKLTIINNGDAPAHNVKLTTKIDSTHQTITDVSVPYTTNKNGDLIMNLGTLPSSKAIEITYNAVVKDSTNNTSITNENTVAETETDNNIKDNTDKTTVTTSVQVSFSGGYYSTSGQTYAPSIISQSQSAPTQKPDLNVERISDHLVVPIYNPQATEMLSIWNKSNYQATNVILHDILTDESGNVIHDEKWNLNTVAPHEEIYISYNIVFKNSIPAGRYILSAKIEADAFPTMTLATSTITVVAMPNTATTTSLPSTRISLNTLKTDLSATSSPVMSFIVPPSNNTLLANVAGIHVSKNTLVFSFLSLILSLILTSVGYDREIIPRAREILTSD